MAFNTRFSKDSATEHGRNKQTNKKNQINKNPGPKYSTSYVLKTPK